MVYAVIIPGALSLHLLLLQKFSAGFAPILLSHHHIHKLINRYAGWMFMKAASRNPDSYKDLWIKLTVWPLNLNLSLIFFVRFRANAKLFKCSSIAYMFAFGAKQPKLVTYVTAYLYIFLCDNDCNNFSTQVDIIPMCMGRENGTDESPAFSTRSFLFPSYNFIGSLFVSSSSSSLLLQTK